MRLLPIALVILLMVGGCGQMEVRICPQEKVMLIEWVGMWVTATCIAEKP